MTKHKKTKHKKTKPRTKKLTPQGQIKQLKQEIATSTADHAAAIAYREAELNDYRKNNETLRRERDVANSSLRLAENQRDAVARQMDAQRANITEYFMAASNMVTGSDKERATDLQKRIAGTSPSYPESRPASCRW